MTIIAATTRGRTSFFAGSPPSARMASTCSVTFIAPDLGRHAAADAAAHDDRGERRPELAQEREHDDARDVLEAAEALQAEGELDGHDHPDEDRRHGDDAQRAHAERLDLVDGRRDLERAAHEGAQRAAARGWPIVAQVLDEPASSAPRRTRAPGASAAAAARRHGRQRRSGGCSGHGFVGRSTDPRGRARAWRPRAKRSNSRRAGGEALRRGDVDQVVDAAVLLHHVDVVLHGDAVELGPQEACAGPRARRRAMVSCVVELALGRAHDEVLGERRRAARRRRAGCSARRRAPSPRALSSRNARSAPSTRDAPPAPPAPAERTARPPLRAGHAAVEAPPRAHAPSERLRNVAASARDSAAHRAQTRASREL